MIQEYTTTRCGRSGQPEFRFLVDPTKVVGIDIDWFKGMLERWVEQGERFAAGETVRAGWALLNVGDGLDNTLVLSEPDFVSMPIVWVPGVTQTLVDLRTHKDVCESYVDDGEVLFPSLRDLCIVCSALEGAEEVLMERQTPSAADSGWFIGCAGETHDHNDPAMLERISLYEAVLRNPLSRMFVALPAGMLLSLAAGSVSVYEGDVELAPKSGSFMAHLLARAAP